MKIAPNRKSGRAVWQAVADGVPLTPVFIRNLRMMAHGLLIADRLTGQAREKALIATIGLGGSVEKSDFDIEHALICYAAESELAVAEGRQPNNIYERLVQFRDAGLDSFNSHELEVPNSVPELTPFDRDAMRAAVKRYLASIPEGKLKERLKKARDLSPRGR